jgi:hypothetical protein
VAPGFSGAYTATELGSIAGVPVNYGGLAFLDENTILIGGQANGPNGAIYAASVNRDISGHVTGFGPASFYSAAPNIDGGLAFGPGGVLFYAAYPTNSVGQIKPGSTSPDRVDVMTAKGVGSSLGALNFVPAGFHGAGQFKLFSHGSRTIYTASLSPDGSGTYNIGLATAGTTTSSGPEGFVYVPIGSDLFPAQSMLVSEYGARKISAYTINSNGDPIPESRQDFVTGISGPEGATFDPLTNDFFFATFGGSHQIVRVSGFAGPDSLADPSSSAIPEPQTYAFMISGLLGIFSLRHRRN